MEWLKVSLNKQVSGYYNKYPLTVVFRLAPFILCYTGLFKSNLYTLIGNYDKYTVCTEKIMVDLFSVHMEISFHNNKSEKK